MLIEEIPQNKASEIFQKSNNQELYTWRIKFTQLFDKYFKQSFVQKVIFQKSGKTIILTQEELLAKYQHLVDEIKRRGVEYTCSHPIDQEIFKIGLWEINIPELKELVVSENHVTLSGAFIQAPRDVTEIDVVITKAEEHRDQNLEKKIKDILKSKTGREINIIYSPEGPQTSYIPVFDLVLRPKNEIRRMDVEDIAKKEPNFVADELKIILTGTGDGNPERKQRSLLLEYGDQQYLIDANPDIQADDFPALKAILICDDSGDKTDAKRIGNVSNIMPVVRKIENGGLTIEPFRIKKTGHRIYGYTIILDKAKIVYAPDFYLLPEKELKRATLAILGGVAWKRPISKAAKSGGHASIVNSWKRMKETGIPVIFTGIGAAVEKNLEEAKKMEIPIAEDGQIITIDAQKVEKTFPIQKPEEEGEEFDIKKPFPNEHACRLRQPGGFKPESFRRAERTTDGKRYNIIMGRLKGEIMMTEQAYRYPKDTWTEAQARAHCKDHDGILFEPASEKVDKKLSEARQKEYDEETALIRENTKKVKYPHKFKAAKWTWPNGHPRCIHCGEEEMVDDKDKQLPCTKAVAKFTIIKIDKKKQIVGGIIYEPDIVDVQGDQASKEEIEKAMHRFMEKYATDTNRIRVMHKGKKFFFPILESFIPDQDTKKGGEIVKAGSWWLMLKVTNPEIWGRLEHGELKGFSLGGRARA